MTFIAIDFLVAALAAVCLYRAQVIRPTTAEIHEDYLSVESGKYVRGLFSLVVVCHHLAQGMQGPFLFPVFSKIGYLTVSVFFFLSGFGLMKQYMQKETYAKKFLLRRLPSVLVPYLIATGLYWLMYQILGEPWSGRAVWMGIVTGTPIVTASWYVICILLFYIAFRMLMLLCGRQYKWMLFGGVVYSCLYVWFCVSRNYGSWWYNTMPVLILGMVWAVYERNISGFFQKRYRIAAPGVFLLFAVLYLSKILLNRRGISSWLAVSMTWCVSGLFACCVFLVFMKLKLRNPLLRWLGEISLEIYLCHYLFIQLFRSERFLVENEFLCIVLVILCTLVFAWGFHLVNRKILKVYSRLLNTYQSENQYMKNLT